MFGQPDKKIRLNTVLDSHEFCERLDSAPVYDQSGRLQMVAVRKDLHDFVFGVSTEERTGVVARHAEAGLLEVVHAEAEELGSVPDFVGVGLKSIPLGLNKWSSAFNSG